MRESTSLTQKHCEPCEGNTHPMTRPEAESYLRQTPGWEMDASGKLISRSYRVKNFMTAVRFIQDIAGIAEAENHHPDLHLPGYHNVKIDLSTHAIGGLSENDFIVAAKVNELKVELKT